MLCYMYAELGSLFLPSSRQHSPYNWIAHQLDIGTTSLILLSRSDFKSQISFGFLNKPTRGMLLVIFCKTSKHARLTSRRVLVFSRGFRHNIGP